MMGMYLIGEVCLNGHEITGNYHPASAHSFCGRCGELAISACPNCKMSIRGDYQHAGNDPGLVITNSEFIASNYCVSCGSAFPWTQKRIEIAQEFADELDELDGVERQKLKASIMEITSDSPRTELAALRVKKLVQKTAPSVGSALKDIVVSIATDAAKKSLGL